MRYLTKLLLALALLCVTSTGNAQVIPGEPPLHAGPTTSKAFGSIITNPFGSPSTGDRVLFATPANNGVLVTNGSGVPSVSATLPSGLGVPSPNLSGTLSLASGTTVGSTATTLWTATLGSTSATGLRINASMTGDVPGSTDSLGVITTMNTSGSNNVTQARSLQGTIEAKPGVGTTITFAEAADYYIRLGLDPTTPSVGNITAASVVRAHVANEATTGNITAAIVFKAQDVDLSSGAGLINTLDGLYVGNQGHGLSLTGDFSSGSPTISNVSSFSHVGNGEYIAGTNIPAGTTILSFDSGAGTITMSANATGTGTTAAFTASRITTSAYGVRIANMTAGAPLTAGYGCEMSVGTGRYCLNFSGSGPNVIRGNTRVGGTTDPTVALDVTGDILTSGSATFGTSTTKFLKASVSAGALTAVNLRADIAGSNAQLNFQNYGITLSGQGAPLLWQYGIGGSLLATGGQINFLTAGDWQTAGAQTSKFVVTVATGSGATVSALQASSTLLSLAGGVLTAGDATVASATATSLTVGANGSTNPAFTVDASTASQVAGLKVTGAVTGGTVAIAPTDSGSNTNLTIQAKGTGTIQIGGTSTGAITLGRATGVSAALTVTSASSQSFAVGPNGATNSVFLVNSATGSQAAGLSLTGAVTGGTVAIAAIDSGSNTNLTINAKGTGTIGIGSVSTGIVTITPAVTMANAGVVMSALASDATHTDATVCKDTTSNTLLVGSGAAGICLGTSSLRFKTDVRPLQPALAQIDALQPISYRYKNGYGTTDRDLYGFAAEQVYKVMPELVGLDRDGRPNSVDWAGVVPVLVNAVKELKADNDNLTVEVTKLKKVVR